jgi:hypothetical protein
MSDPNRIQGPGSPPELSQAKRDRTVGSDDFKKYMIEETKETDPEQRGKKRKRREEGEEETEAEKKAIGALPQRSSIPPLKKGVSRSFSMEETPLPIPVTNLNTPPLEDPSLEIQQSEEVLPNPSIRPPEDQTTEEELPLPIHAESLAKQGKKREPLQPGNLHIPHTPPLHLPELLEEKGHEAKPENVPMTHSKPSTPPPLPTPLTPPNILVEPTESTSTTISPYATLHPDILRLFERIVGVLTVMRTAGITETTLHLDNFAGANLHVTITQYRFAAGELNIEFSTINPGALSLVQAQFPNLNRALAREGVVIKRSYFFHRKGGLTKAGSEEEQSENRGKSR